MLLSTYSAFLLTVGSTMLVDFADASLNNQHELTQRIYNYLKRADNCNNAIAESQCAETHLCEIIKCRGAGKERAKCQLTWCDHTCGFAFYLDGAKLNYEDDCIEYNDVQFEEAEGDYRRRNDEIDDMDLADLDEPLLFDSRGLPVKTGK